MAVARNMDAAITAVLSELDGMFHFISDWLWPVRLNTLVTGKGII